MWQQRHAELWVYYTPRCCPNKSLMEHHRTCTAPALSRSDSMAEWHLVGKVIHTPCCLTLWHIHIPLYIYVCVYIYVHTHTLTDRDTTQSSWFCASNTAREQSKVKVLFKTCLGIRIDFFSASESTMKCNFSCWHIGRRAIFNPQKGQGRLGQG